MFMAAHHTHKIPSRAPAREGILLCDFHFFNSVAAKNFFSFGHCSTERTCNGLHSFPKTAFFLPLVFPARHWELPDGD